jgi:hypothetical protein
LGQALAKNSESTKTLQAARDVSDEERPQNCVANSGIMKTLQVRTLKTKRNETHLCLSW